MELSQVVISQEKKQQLLEYVYKIIGCIQETHKDLGPGMPEYIYQEALCRDLREHGFEPLKEYQHHPVFHGQQLEAYLKMDLVVPMPQGNVIIESKAITELGRREQFQTYGYLRGTEFPVAILVNFGTWPKAQIQRFYYDKETKVIHAF